MEPIKVMDGIADQHHLIERILEDDAEPLMGAIIFGHVDYEQNRLELAKHYQDISNAASLAAAALRHEKTN